MVALSLAVMLVGIVLTSMSPMAMAADRINPTRAPISSGTDILAQVRAASGGVAWRRIDGLQAEGRVRYSGLDGRWSRRDDLVDGRWTVSNDSGVYRTAEGFDGAVRWRQDPSGGVHAFDAPFSKRAAITDAWLTRRAWLKSAADKATLGRTQTRVEDGRTFAVVEATPRGGQPVELWFDTATRQLARTVRVMPISTVTVRYDDYRSVGGAQLPFRIETRDSGSSDIEVVDVARWSVQAPNDAAFVMPTPPDDAALDGETTIPIEIDGHVIVEARLNGQPFDFILDTGGHNIITPDVATALGVKPVGAGATGGSGAGELAQQYVRIEQLEVGAAKMRDQHFYVIPFQYSTLERGTRPRLAGLLGLELFERFATRIDYPGKTLTLRRFDSKSIRRDGRVVAMVFDDDIPLIEGRIDGLSGLFALDTGNAGSTVVQGVWAAKNGLAERLRRGIETVSYGAGGASRNWASRVNTLEIGGVVFKRPIVRYAEDQAGAFASQTESANIGTDVLANFVVDFDYRSSSIWFDYRPGYSAPPFNRAGMRTTKDDAESFRVALVVPGSPAAAAGIARDDRIVSVDGVAATDMSGREFARKLAQPPGTEVAFTIKRGEEERQATVRLLELLP